MALLRVLTAICVMNLIAVTAKETTSTSMTPYHPVHPCTDSPIVNCTKLDIYANICDPITPATTLYCPNTCRRCDALLVIGAISNTLAINCRYCAGVTDPHFCAEVVQCRQDEECFSDLVIGDMGNTFYNSGCRHKYVCNLIVQSMGGKQKRNQLPVCEECCGKDQCNTGLCMEPRNETKPDCYSCDSVDSPYDCHNRVSCNNDETCITEAFLEPTTFATKYKLSCEKNTRCDLLNSLGRRDTTTCIECCPHSGCNRHLCYEGPRPNQGQSIPPGVQTTSGAGTAAAAQTTQTTSAPATAAPTTTPTAAPQTSAPATSAGASSVSVDASCVDSDLVDCKELDSVSNICADITDATRLYCPRFCGVCGQAQVNQATTTTAATTTVASGTTCTDSPIVNCTELDITTSICNPVTPATSLYCAGHCKLTC